MSKRFWETRFGRGLLSAGVAATNPFARFNHWARKVHSDPREHYRQKFLDEGEEALNILRSDSGSKKKGLCKAAMVSSALADFDDAESKILIAALEQECVDARTEMPPDLKEMLSAFSNALNLLKEAQNA